VVWDQNGNRREEETVVSLVANRDRLLRTRAELAAHRPGTPPEFIDPKGSAPQIWLHPELSLAIRNRIRRADMSSFLSRRTVDFGDGLTSRSPSLRVRRHKELLFSQAGMQRETST
jgi:hypothetical protein